MGMVEKATLSGGDVVRDFLVAAFMVACAAGIGFVVKHLHRQWEES